MIRIENTLTTDFAPALRGMRNPLNSWGKASPEADMKLAKKLISAGTEHRKFLRMIHVTADVTAPAYFMAEFDTYKVGTTRNSCSFMHKGVSKPFEIEDFSVPDEVIGILSMRKGQSKKAEIFYPYETEEFKVYICENGREYEVYKNGRVFSKPFSCVDNYGTGRERKFERKECFPTLSQNGYWYLNIGGRNGERWQLHRLVAFCWCNNPENFETVDHLDGNKNNNSAENLEWVSLSENIKRGFANGLMRKGDLHANYLNWKASSKIPPDRRRKIRDEWEAGTSQRELALKYQVSQSQMWVICNDKDGTSPNKDLFEYCLHWEDILKTLNEYRDLYLETKDMKYFRIIRALLPMSYLYRSTVDLDYETLLTIHRQRKNHKLTEWHVFCDWVESLPMMGVFIEAAEGGKNDN